MCALSGTVAEGFGSDNYPSVGQTHGIQGPVAFAELLNPETRDACDRALAKALSGESHAWLRRAHSS